ncbi:unnamed protein product, partial [Hapterophycus canaliculatus]
LERTPDKGEVGSSSLPSPTKSSEYGVKAHAMRPSALLCLRKVFCVFGDQKHEDSENGAIAQLGERLLCTQEVCGSIPHSSTTF